MFHSYMDALAFHCLSRLKEERTVYSALHIISGKKTSQTIQDCHLFGLSVFFRTNPNLTREAFDASISRLADTGYIRIKDAKGNYALNPSGAAALQDFSLSLGLPKHINGFLYQNSFLTWQRFNLLFQVISNGVHQNKTYLPIQRDIAIQRWVKRFLYGRAKDFTGLAKDLHDELERIFAELPDLHVQVLMMRLSGFHRVGYSVEQISKKMGRDLWHIHYLFLDAFHYLLTRAQSSPEEFPLLSAVLKEEEKQQSTTLTRSSFATFQFIQKGYGIEEIMGIRKLKRNTIEDHLVEIALHVPDFDVAPYINDELLKDIHSLVGELDTKQLKVLKKHLPDNVAYFQIRLALAKGGEMHES